MRSLCAISLIVGMLHAHAQPDNLWTRCLGGGGTDQVYSIQQTTDGGYVLAGWTGSTDGDVHGIHGPNYFDVWVVKLDAAGDTLWTKCLGGSSSDQAYSIQQTGDGGYVVAGYTNSTDGDVHGNHGSDDFWVVKLDALGDTIWTKCVGGSTIDQAYSIELTSDGGYVVAGYTRSTDGDVHGHHNNLSPDAWVVKLDAAGDTLWTKCLGGTSSDQANSIQQTSDGGYVVAGWTASNNGDVHGNHGNSDAWVVKLDAAGDTLWTNSLGGTDGENAYNILQTNDGGYVVAGNASSTNGDVHGSQGNRDAWIVKLNAPGDTLWTKCLGGSNWDQANSIKQTTDGGYVVAGYASSTDGDVHGFHGNSDAWVVKLDAAGDTLWTKCLGGSMGDDAQSIQQTSDGGYVMAGNTRSIDGDVYGHHGDLPLHDVWVVKLGMNNVGLSEVEASPFTIAPNPTTGAFTLQLVQPALADQVTLLDATGRMVLSQRINTTGTITLDVSAHENGLYFVHVRFADGSTATERVVKQ